MMAPKQQPKKAAPPKAAQPQKRPPTPAKEAAKVTDTVQQIATQTSKKGGAGSGDSTPINSGATSKAAARPTRILDLPRNVGNEVAVPTVKPMDMPRNVGNKVAVPAVKPMDMPRNVGNKVAVPAVKPMDMPRNVGNQVAQPAVKPMDLPRNVGNQVAVPAVKPLDLPSNDVQPTTTAPKAGLSEAEQLLIQHTPELQTAAPEVATATPGAAAPAGKTAGKKKKKTSQKGTKAKKASTAEGAAKAGVAEGEAATMAQSPSEVISSMRQQPPLKAYTDMANSGNALQQATQNSMNSTKEGMDEITISSGIIAATEPKTPKPKVVAQEKAPAMHKPAAAEKVSASKETENIESTAEAGAIKEVSTAKGAFINNLKQSRAATDQISGAAQSDLGATPDASLDAASNPDQMGANTAAGQQSVANTLANAQQATTQDFGESGMFPKHEEKKARVQLTEQITEARSGLSSEVEDSQFSELEEIEVNKQLETQHGAEMAKAQTQLEQAESDKETGVTNEKANLNTQMQTATEDAKTQQRAERAKGQTAVAKQKQNWQSENQKIKGDAESKLSTEQAKSESKIAQKQAEGDQKIAETYNKADADIAAANKDADEKIAAKEKEGEKAEEKGWLDSAIDWVSEQFDKIKEAVNAVFDALRSAVKKAVAWAKEKASSIINSLRDFAVSAIKAFGELAKSIVNIALAAFPGLAKKFNALIDMAVNTAVTAVNMIASALEKAVHALIDLAGKVIDGIIAIYQKAINLALDVLEAITVGVLIIIKKIGWLGVAAKASPDHFFPQMGSELLGQDLEEPLENEIPKVFGLTMEDVKKNDAIAASMGTSEMTEEASLTEDTSILDKSSYVASDFDVPVQDNPQLSDALMAEIAAMPEGVPVEIGAVNDDEHGIDAVKGDLAATAMTTTDTSTETTADAGPPFVTTEMMNNIPESDKKAQGWVGPFTSVWDRTKAAAGGMVDGVTKWWEENKVGLLIKLGLGIAGLILANVLTGGAIMAALPLFLELLSAYFLGDAIYQLGKHFKSFLLKGWDGDIQGASKSLARGLAILVIELVFALLFGAKAVFQSVKAGVKAAKGGVKGLAKAAKGTVKNYAKQQVKNGVRLAAVTRNGAKRAVKKGKIAMQGMKQGSLKGAKSLKSAGKALSKRLGFDRFRITRSGKFFKLEGHVNPWVLLASGEVKHVDADKVKGKTLGSKVDMGNQEGILIGKQDIKPSSGVSGLDGKDVRGSDFVQKMANNKGKAEEMYKKLNAKDMDDVSRNTKILNSGGSSIYRDPNFATNYWKQMEDVLKQRGIKISAELKKMIAVHHIIPNSLRANKKIADFLESIGKSIDDMENAIGLPTMDLKAIEKRIAELKKVSNIEEFNALKKRIKLPENASLSDVQRLADELKQIKEFANASAHYGSHIDYTNEIRDNLLIFARMKNKQKAKEMALNYIENIRNGLSNGTIKLFD